jgi:hypothetical protein
MAVIGFCGVAFAGLRSASDLWASVLFTVAVVLLLGVILGAWHSRGRARAGWFGFLVFGWGYLIFSFGTWFSAPLGPPPLLSTHLLDLLYPRVHPSPPQLSETQGWLVSQPVSTQTWGSVQPASVQSPNISRLTFAGPAAPAVGGPNRENFVRSGHSLLVIVVALMGSAFARFLFDKRRDSDRMEPASGPTAG